ncbi:capsular biosynthesis protein [Ancylobacter sp. 6x-1]|uniref:Capsular biosynthesis protein n=1 Tax=Ancylobacter crimeensis TaxID=2579147 RepID=A0ABT0DAN7_9HYPH|nr:capsular biosynthesis protein [Ancylobacter crimeensis]MCK0197002.1 capsular biosynthesis protein [Ancylobacter crimeensis]
MTQGHAGWRRPTHSPAPADNPAEHPSSARLSGKDRTFLFLQGPASPFAFRLAGALRSAGAGVVKVHLCGGDMVFWPGVAHLYRQRFEDWPAYVTALLTAGEITDLVLFGDCRPYHAPAVAAAHEQGIRVHLFEEGYVRPGYVTCENHGVNAHSDLPRTPQAVLEAAALLPEPARPEPVAEPFRMRAQWDIAWHVGLATFWLAFARYRRHTLAHPAADYAGWVLHALRSPLARRRDRRAYARIREGAPYFLFPLQLPGDFQMRVHSDFASIEQVAQTVIGSFARAAPAEARLIVKRHPYDVGFIASARMIARLAAANGIADRVVFVEDGDVAPLVARAEGVVLVNSTTAMLALDHRRPLKVLGRATYDMPGLSHQGSLDSFWTAPEPPEPGLTRAYRRVVVARTQLPGGFFSVEGIERLVPACVSRMLAPAEGMQ